ncbi:MAG TPA: cupin domain-containing protein [Gaiellaceae bacterium]|nr:cupin domain-containing protein [Gaiellaceae bacterium]
MLWFLDTLVNVRVSHDAGADGISVVESLARRGDSPPYHVHHTEDEVFHLLEGELRLLVDGKRTTLHAGETLLAPKDVPHTYCVTSVRARWLVVTTNGDFERFVRELSRPAEAAELPPPAGPPSAEEQRLLAEAAARHGIELIGPPLSEELAA